MECLLLGEGIKCILEKLLAYLTIKQILDQMTSSENQTLKAHLKNRAIEISLEVRLETFSYDLLFKKGMNFMRFISLSSFLIEQRKLIIIKV